MSEERLIRNGGFFMQGHIGWGAIEEATRLPEAEARKKCKWMNNVGWTNAKVVTLDGEDSLPSEPTPTVRARKPKAVAPPVVAPPQPMVTASAQPTLPGVDSAADPSGSAGPK